jgi:phosphoserine phosphatase
VHTPAWPPLGGSGFLRAAGWAPEIRTSLERLVANPGTDAPLAAVDLDHTCLVGDVSETALALLAEQTGRDLVREYETACRGDLRSAFVELVFTLLEERTEPEGRALAELALDEGGRRGVLGIRPALRELVWALHRFGWEVYVVSASPEVLVQTAAERLGIHPHRALGMRPTLTAGGRFARPIVEPIPFREGKLQRLLHASGRSPTLAIGDSEFDLPLLAGARHGLLIDRNDPAVRAAAQSIGAWIQPEEPLR